MLDNEDLFDALADSRRRRLLLELFANNPRIVPQLSEDSRTVAAADEELLRAHLSSSRTIDGVDEDRLRLHLVHLPKLADYGFVMWDRDAHLVTKGSRFDEMTAVLELLDEQSDDGTREVAAAPVLGDR